jgi:ABC-type multidrug transport system ATPase subunit
MEIVLHDAGKRFNREWIFRHISLEFSDNRMYVITGPNGSGKSTLLQTLAGYVQLNEGEIRYRKEAEQIAPESMYRHLAVAAPYLSLVEEMTASELLHFHKRLKPLTLADPEILAEARLEKEANKQIRYFSSGMKQRLKLALAFFSNTALLLLDEPLTNLDADGASLYHQWIERHCRNRLVIVASNNPEEYRQCTHEIPMKTGKLTAL